MDVEKLKQLREMTSAGMLECKKVLDECSGDITKAVDLLRERGIVKAAKRVDRDASEGAIVSYIHHNNKVGVLVRLNCETDFVAKNERFLELGKDIAMHIAAMNPQYLSVTDVPEEDINKEKKVLRSEVLAEGKPENVVDKILSGKLKKHLSTMVLLEQSFVKEPKITIGDLIKESITRLGENIQLARFVRFEI